MSTYDKPQTEVYYIPSFAFGNSTATKTLKGPKGKKGVVRDIIMIPSADMVGTTTVPELDVGSASGLVEYARFRLGSTAILGYTAAAGIQRAAALVSGPANTGGIPPVQNDFAGHVALETSSIPADTAFVVTSKAGVGGAPAGTAEFYVQIDWF
jgi:hypothetical protein